MNAATPEAPVKYPGSAFTLFDLGMMMWELKERWKNIAVGFAVPNGLYWRLRYKFPQVPGTLIGCEIPMILDPRIPEGDVQIYYDRKEWDARCKEQAAWEAKISLAIPARRAIESRP